MCIYVQNMKFLWSNLWTGGLSTDDNNDDDNDAHDDTRRTIHDCIGSLAWLPNEPITTNNPCLLLSGSENGNILKSLYKTH